MVTNSASLYGINPDTFFNTKGLKSDAVTRLNDSVKAARATLDLADKLQTLRDNNRAQQKLEQSLKSTTSSLQGRYLDLYS